MHLSYSVARVSVSARRAEIRRRNTRLDRPRCRGGVAACPVGLGGRPGLLAGLCGRGDTRQPDQGGRRPGVHPLRIGSPARGQLRRGKPMRITEARDLNQSGLKIVSCYQYGKESSADWLGGQGAGVTHAKRGWQLHMAAGGPAGAPIYASIDDDPSFEQYKQQVAPYLRGWESVLGHQRVGVYGNSKTIDWALQDGLGSYFWQHNWVSPGGYTHPAANLHQVEIDKRNVGGVGVDINNICKPQFGQWGLS